MHTKKPVFEGSATALITPMDRDGSVSLGRFREQVRFQLEQEADALVVAGVIGEAAALSHRERQDLIFCAAQCVAVSNRKIPVIADATSNCTQQAAALSKEAKEAGANALIHVTPYYNKTSQQGLLRHFEVCANATDLPVLLCHSPARTGMGISEEICVALSILENIAGIVDTQGDLIRVGSLIGRCGADLPVYSGCDELTLPILSLGGKGAVSVLGNLLPLEMHQLCACFSAGQLERSRSLQLRYLPLCRALSVEIAPIPIKAAMELLNRGGGPCRSPLDSLEPDSLDQLRKALELINLL